MQANPLIHHVIALGTCPYSVDEALGNPELEFDFGCRTEANLPFRIAGALSRCLCRGSYFERALRHRGRAALIDLARAECAAVKIQHAWRSSCREKRETRLILREGRKEYRSDLAGIRERFEFIRFVNEGGYSCLFRVRDRKDAKIKIFRWSDDPIDHPDTPGEFGQWAGAYATIRLVSRKYTPHLVPSSPQIRVKLSGDLTTDDLKTYFFGGELPDTEEKSKKRGFSWGTVERSFTLMPERSGSLESLVWKKAISNAEYTAYRIQFVHATTILDRYACRTHDEKNRNKLYHPLSPEDKLRGQRLQDYDFWLYRIGDDSFYIPKQRYVLEFCDYGRWASSLEHPAAHRSPRQLGGSFRENALRYFGAAPTASASILDMDTGKAAVICRASSSTGLKLH